MVLPFALWGTAMAAMKPLLEGATPLTIAWMRLLPAGLLLLLVAALSGRSLAVAAADRGWLLLFALVDGSLFQAFLTQGLGETGAALGSVLIDSQPLAVALLARLLFDEAINPVGWLGLLLGLAGIACLGLPGPLLRHWLLGGSQLLDGPQLLGGHAWSQGELWMLGAAMAMAVGTVLCRYACRNTDALVITGWHLVIGSLPLLAACLAKPVLDPAAAPFWPAWSGSDWVLMAYASLLGSGLAYGLFFWFASRGDLTSFTSLTFLTPLFALLCGLALLGESLRPLQWLGAGLALVSVALINRRRQLWEPEP
ncbi:MAG: DMT family transporter [Cyanobacteria bacterium]|nr:DMT family transporter [Cyanobacteriota bacterium]